MSDYFATLLVQGRYPVMARDTVAAKLAEQGSACQDHACRAKLAGELSARYFVSTRIMRIAGTCRVMATLYGVRSTVAQRAGTAGGGCTRRDLLTALEAVADKMSPAPKMSAVAGEPAARPSEPFAPVIWGKQTGRLSLNSVPWGRVWIDGRDTGKTTPLYNYELPAGRHRVTVHSPNGGEMSAVVEIWPDEATSLIVRSWKTNEPVAGETGLLLLNTQPWSQVTIDGEHTGMTPISRHLPAGKHQIQLTFAHAEVLREEVEIRAGETTKLVRRAKTPENYKFNQGMGLLKIHSSPWARVWVDGKDLGTATPVFSCQLPSGRHELAIHFASGGYLSEEVVIKPGETTRKIIREK
jgi:hypothetical protein